MDAKGIKFVEKLNSGQQKALELIKKFKYVLLFGGARSGKSLFLVLALVYRSLTFPGSRHLIVRLRFNHAKTSIWMETLLPLIDKLPTGLVKINHSDHYIQFWNKSQIWIAGLDDKQRIEKALGYEYVTVYFNETSEMVDYTAIELIMTRLAQKIDGCTNKAYFDCNPPDDLHWTCQLFINHVHPLSNEPITNPDDYGAMVINPEHNRENLPEGYIENTLGNLSGPQRDRFLYGLFGSNDAINQLIMSEYIMQCREPLETKDARQSLGIDVGRYGPDKTVFFSMDGPNIRDIEKHAKTSTTDVSDRAIRLIFENEISHDYVGIDGIGIGAGVCDNMFTQGYRIAELISGEKPIDAYKHKLFRFYNLRAQMYWVLMEDIKADRIGGIKEPTLIADLKMIRYEIMADKKVKIWGKDEMQKEYGRSPDIADAFCLCNWVRRRRSLAGGGRRLTSNYEL